jgi:hypothetical protein
LYPLTAGCFESRQATGNSHPAELPFLRSHLIVHNDLDSPDNNMSADNETEAVAPAWGALPVEQYLIVSPFFRITITQRVLTVAQRNWDPSSELSTEDQRAALVAAYIDEDVLDAELLASPPSRVPTAAEIANILEPWRPQKLRRIAAAHIKGTPHEFYFLRTHYAGGAADDAKLRGWLDQDEGVGPGIEPEDEWFSVLDDPELFDFGDDWLDVYEVLPELAAPRPDRRFTDEDVSEARDWARDSQGGEPVDEDYEDAIMQIATIGPTLIVLDEEAFRAGELGMIFRDKKGNPVKDSWIFPDELGAWIMKVFRGAMYEGYWEHAVVAQKYRTRGRIMRKLLPLVKAQGE